MRTVCGPLLLNEPDPGEEGKPVLGHRHKFDHLTVVHFDAYDISLLAVTEVDVFDRPLKATVVDTVTIRAGSDKWYYLILAGQWHTLVPHTSRARFGCLYPHLAPQAITFPPGQKTRVPWTKRDENGALWIRADETIRDSTEGMSQAWIEVYSG